MDHEIANLVNCYLRRQEWIEEEEIEISQYGLELIISSGIGFLLIILIGIVMGKGIEMLVYLVVLVSLRSFTGGYHAKTYLRCNILLILNSLVVLYMLNLLHSHISNVIPVSLVLGIGILEKYAPVEHVNKRICKEDKSKLRRIAQGCYLLYSFLSWIFCQKGMINMGIIITATQCEVLLFIIISIIEGGEKNREDNNW